MNSPLASTPSIASRMRGKSGSYCAFTSTRGIRRTARKSRLSPLHDPIARQGEDQGDDCVLDVAEAVVEVLVAAPGSPARAGERERPDRRAERRQRDIAPELHAEDAGRNRDERPRERCHAAEQHGPVAPAVEPPLGPVELVTR